MNKIHDIEWGGRKLPNVTVLVTNTSATDAVLNITNVLPYTGKIISVKNTR